MRACEALGFVECLETQVLKLRLGLEEGLGMELGLKRDLLGEHKKRKR